MKTFKAFIMEATKPGLYSAFNLEPESADRLHNFYAQHLGADAVQPPSKFHITTVYSPKHIDHTPAAGGFQLNCTGHDMFECGATNHVIVLRVEHPKLTEQWQAARNAGASWDYPDYKPHISLTNYAFPINRDTHDIEKLPLPDFPITVANEQTSPLES